MSKAGLMMSVKQILICHNQAHVKVLRGILRSFIMADFDSQADVTLSKYAPAELQEQLNKAKPDRLKVYESQKKRGLQELDTNTPEAKRVALAESRNTLSPLPPACQ